MSAERQPCIALNCDVVNEGETYSLDRWRSLPQKNNQCDGIALNCDFPSDLDLYTLDGISFFMNDWLTFVVDCPPGYYCPGWPVIRRMPPGVIPRTPIPPITGANQEIPLQLQCCENQYVNGKITVVVNPGSIAGLYSGTVNTSFGGVPGATTTFTNQTVSAIQALVTNIMRQLMTRMVIECERLSTICTSVIGGDIFPPESPRNPNLPPPPPFTPPPQVGTYLLALSDITKDTACLGFPFNAYVTAIGPFGPFNWAVVGGTFPPGLSHAVVSFNGLRIYGTPTTGGSFTFRLLASNTKGKIAWREYTITILALASSTLPNAQSCSNYSANLVGMFGTPPYTFTPDPSFPPPSWMTIDSSGFVSGRPLAIDAGTTETFGVIIADSTGNGCSQDVTITTFAPPGPCFTNGALPDADTEGTHYSVFLVPSAPAEPTYLFTLLAGSLPAGISLNANTGEISGNTGPPAQAWPITVGLSGVCFPCQQNFTITTICHPGKTDTLHGQTYALVGEGLFQDFYYIVQRTGVPRNITAEVTLTYGATDNISITASVGIYNEEGHFAWGGAAVVIAGGTSGSCDGPVVATGGPNTIGLDSCVLYSVTLKLEVTRINPLPNPVSCPVSAVLNIHW